jgi:hypothetical protein
VAQDITMSEFTPVTQEFLWIYKLSLGSKIFVMLGIVQSIIALYIFNHDDDDTKNKDQLLSGAAADVEEEHPFLESFENSNDNSMITPPLQPRRSSLPSIIEDPGELTEDEEENAARQQNMTTNETCKEARLSMITNATYNESRQSMITNAPYNEALQSATANATYIDNDVTNGRDRENRQDNDSSVRGGRNGPRTESRRNKGMARNKSGSVLKSTVKVLVGEHLIPNKEESKKLQKIKKLLIVDKITAMCFFLAYGIFLVGMFVIIR